MHRHIVDRCRQTNCAQLTVQQTAGRFAVRVLNCFITSSGQLIESDYYSFEARFIRSTPIRSINFSDPAGEVPAKRAVGVARGKSRKW